MTRLPLTRYVPANAGHDARDAAFQQISELLGRLVDDPAEDIEWTVADDGGGLKITGTVQIPEPRQSLD